MQQRSAHINVSCDAVSVSKTGICICSSCVQNKRTLRSNSPNLSLFSSLPACLPACLSQLACSLVTGSSVLSCVSLEMSVGGAKFHCIHLFLFSLVSDPSSLSLSPNVHQHLAHSALSAVAGHAAGGLCVCSRRPATSGKYATQTSAVLLGICRTCREREREKDRRRDISSSHTYARRKRGARVYKVCTWQIACKSFCLSLPCACASASVSANVHGLTSCAAMTSERERERLAA